MPARAVGYLAQKNEVCRKMLEYLTAAICHCCDMRSALYIKMMKMESEGLN